MSIGKPTADRHGVLRVEDIRRWRIVDDDGFSQIAANLRQVLDVVALVVVATFAEQAVMHDIMDVKLVEERVTILEGISVKIRLEEMLPTFETEAVKTTTS